MPPAIRLQDRSRSGQISARRKNHPIRNAGKQEKILVLTAVVDELTTSWSDAALSAYARVGGYRPLLRRQSAVATTKSRLKDRRKLEAVDPKKEKGERGHDDRDWQSLSIEKQV